MLSSCLCSLAFHASLDGCVFIRTVCASVCLFVCLFMLHVKCFSGSEIFRIVSGAITVLSSWKQPSYAFVCLVGYELSIFLAFASLARSATSGTGFWLWEFAGPLNVIKRELLNPFLPLLNKSIQHLNFIQVILSFPCSLWEENTSLSQHSSFTAVLQYVANKMNLFKLPWMALPCTPGSLIPARHTSIWWVWRSWGMGQRSLTMRDLRHCSRMSECWNWQGENDGTLERWACILGHK